MGFARGWSLLLPLVLVFTTYAHAQNPKVFNVQAYGAIADGKTDNSQAFLQAWNDACKWSGKSVVVVPNGTYVVDAVLFLGPCTGSVTFSLVGVLKTPSNAILKDSSKWVTFRYVDRLNVDGGGTLDGDGQKVWSCHKNSNCFLPPSMSLEFVNNARVSNITSMDSQGCHFSLFSCQNLTMTDLRLSAPDDSPNTDGIKIGSSTNVSISQTEIKTGDDCIAIISGSRDITVSGVVCGPGHGISVGSMGLYANNDIVEGVIVKNCTFNGTSTGVRIKTWASSTTGSATRFIYQDLKMVDVQNPVVIDQLYCPSGSCDQKIPSHIQIKSITYNNIWGTYTSGVAVTFNCSRRFPCKDILMKDIDLSQNRDGSSKSACSYAFGNAYGKQRPTSCLSH